ncbi:hypothetical protein GCM10008967_08870 [Bacillus carboniphilus]|uniref:Uncharacterized protein n=1 Tax=Bacillus carboniphilus TaxID=86663 RepID=A0ABN0VYI4_9BACI
MDKVIFLFLSAILAGFALVKVNLLNTPLESLESIFTLIGVISVLVFSLVIIFKAFMALFNR